MHGCAVCARAAVLLAALALALGGSSDPQPIEILAITGLDVAANPHSSLACRVTWHTAQPSTSVVQFGLGSMAAPTWQRRDPTLRTEHQLDVYGLRAQSTYRLVVKSQLGSQVVSQTRQFTTGALPLGVAAAVVDGAGSPPDGWILASTHLGWAELGGLPTEPPAAVMYDGEGQPVWYYQLPAGKTVYASLVDDGRAVLMGSSTFGAKVDLAGDFTWQKPASAMVLPDLQPGGVLVGITGMAHHELRQLSNGNFAELRLDVRGTGNEQVTGDELVEMAPDGKKLWSWNTFDHLTVGQGDWVHGNSLQIDTAAGTALYSARNISQIRQIDVASGKVLWTAGTGGTLTLDTASGGSWFALQHSPTLLPGNRLLLLDNGEAARRYSRAVEYQLDLQAQTAKQVWEYSGPKEDQWFSVGEGSVERLANGDTLIGGPDFVTGQGLRPTRIFVVGPDGALKWRLKLPTIAGFPQMVYRVTFVGRPGLEVVAP